MPPRFFHADDLYVGQCVELEITTAHHAARVLRIKTGDPIILFNGKGGEFSAYIESIRKTTTRVIIDQFNTTERESPLTIDLVQAICVNEKMDLIIQKSVELGVTGIQPISTTRSIVRLSKNRTLKRLQHWQRIIISACEQCGRNYIPTISPLISLTEWVSRRKNNAPKRLCFMLSTTAKESLKNLPEPLSSALHFTIVVGPEGGLTSEEEMILQQVDFQPMHIGKRILRTETAALATIAAMQMRWGDF